MSKTKIKSVIKQLEYVSEKIVNCGNKSIIEESIKQLQEIVNKKKTSLVSKEVKELRLKIKKVFLDFYKNETDGSNYYWSAKDSAALIRLIKKINLKIEERYPKNPNKDDFIIDGFTHLIYSITDKWILNNLSITIIDSKFNDIFLQLKRRQNEKNNKSAEQQFIDDAGARDN